MKLLLFLLLSLLLLVVIFASSAGLVIGGVYLLEPFLGVYPEEIVFPIMWIVACLIWIALSLYAILKLRRTVFRPS